MAWQSAILPAVLERFVVDMVLECPAKQYQQVVVAICSMINARFTDCDIPHERTNQWSV